LKGCLHVQPRDKQSKNQSIILINFAYPQHIHLLGREVPGEGGQFPKTISARQKLLKKNRARGAMGKKSSECLLLLLFYFCCYKISAQAISHQRKSCRTLKWGKKFRAPKNCHPPPFKK